jgi:tripartite-type tricarboxylate transporter receptor subunit TctC
VNKRLISVVFCSLLILLPRQSPAQERYPARPIRIIHSYVAGSGSEIIMRTANQVLQRRLGQPLTLESRPGGSSIIAAEACARAVPDGYTLCLVNPGTLSFNPYLFPRLPYDADRDFRPITNLFFQIEGLVVTGALPARSLAALRELAIARRGAINFGTLAPGTGPDLFRQWLAERWGTELTGVPYKGGPLIINALASGEIHMSWIGAYNVGGQVRSGRIRILAVGGSKRSPLLPEVPTLPESGLPPQPTRPWVGIAAPAGAPDAVVSRIDAELLQLFHEPRFARYLDTQYVEAAVGTPDEFAAFLKADREKAGELIRRYH